MSRHLQWIPNSKQAERTFLLLHLFKYSGIISLLIDVGKSFRLVEALCCSLWKPRNHAGRAMHCYQMRSKRYGWWWKGGVDVPCDAERGDNEPCLSLPHSPLPSTFHAISAICCPDCASSSAPMTKWLAALPLSSGLSLWISMCFSSTSPFLRIVSFISFPSFILSLFLSKSPQSARSQVMMPRERGAFADQLMTFTKG